MGARVVRVLLTTWVVLAGQACRADDQRPHAYELAISAAAHQFAESNEVGHLLALIEKHPKLLNAPRLQISSLRQEFGDGLTLLHRAARKGHIQMVETLVRLGARVNSLDGGEGWAPIHFAASAGRLDVVRKLVEAGADPLAKTRARPAQIVRGATESSRRTMFGEVPAQSARELALITGKTEVVEYLDSLK